MKRVFRLHRIFISQHLKRLMEYKVDFTVGAIGFLLGQAVEILFYRNNFFTDSRPCRLDI